MSQEHEVKKYVKDRYGRIASAGESCCSCCGGPDAMEQAKSMGYTEKEIGSLPPEALMGLGCGNPTAFAELKEGETVLDLGCGGGLDVFLAAQRVGQAGKVIGVDMTPEMIEKARENARKGEYGNVDFRLGEIESLPVEDNSIDVIISNCVINLTTDKLAAYREAHRVLRPGGRILISDLVTEGQLPEDIHQSFAAWAACIAGAVEKGEYLRTIEQAGFRDVAVAAEKRYLEPGIDSRLVGKITSIQVRAFK
jgi:ubiquinone/menaquinone biosynthesis C-methylase UbiE